MALLLVMFYVSGLLTGLALNWTKTREARMRYERQELRFKKRSNARSKVQEMYLRKLETLNAEAENED